MKLSVPIWLVAIVASFVYALLKQYFPELPLTEEQVQYLIITILALAGIDVVNALRKANPGLLK